MLEDIITACKNEIKTKEMKDKKPSDPVLPYTVEDRRVLDYQKL